MFPSCSKWFWSCVAQHPTCPKLESRHSKRYMNLLQPVVINTASSPQRLGPGKGRSACGPGTTPHVNEIAFQQRELSLTATVSKSPQNPKERKGPPEPMTKVRLYTCKQKACLCPLQRQQTKEADLTNYHNS